MRVKEKGRGGNEGEKRRGGVAMRVRESGTGVGIKMGVEEGPG